CDSARACILCVYVYPMAARCDWFQLRGSRWESPRIGEEPDGRAASPVRSVGQDRPSVPGEPQMTMPTNLRRGASAIALGLALSVFVPGAAMAQDADTAPAGEAPSEDAIVVTGIRGAINN